MFDLVKILAHMGLPAKLITLTLALMAVASLGVFFERLFAFWRSRMISKRFANEARRILKTERPEHIVAAANAVKGSHLAKLLGTGMQTFNEFQAQGGKLAPIEATKRELVRKNEALAAEVRRGMSVLASVGSIAPFVGLLGTVVGIIEAFQGIAKEGSGGLGAVSAGISEALVVTAFGLMVAIPAVIFYNMLATQSDAILRNLEQAKGEFLDFLENRFGKGAGNV
jgi:biopolymer transport protein ExbB